MKNKYLSRKFLMALVAAGVIIANEGLGLNLPKEEIFTVAGVVIAYIVGESYVDRKKFE
jgi:hypothetical protein